MKKIGCVLAYCNNYGTMLQSYATLRMIQSLGFSCEIIRYKKHLSFKRKLTLIINYIRIGDFASKKRLLHNKICYKLYPQYREGKNNKKKAFLKFANKHLIPFFKEYDGYDELKKGAFRYNLVLVGSDQVWSLMSLYSGFYNLLFVDSTIPKVAYASSFGVSSIPPFQHKATKAYLDRFAKIGVREESGKKIVESLSANSATVVADPSMFLTKEEWENEIKDIKIETPFPYIFCYFLGNSKKHRDEVCQLKKITGCKIIAICHNDEFVKSDENFADFLPSDVGPLEFVKYIKDAKYVCTDSFHGAVFSIIFHKQFLSFYRFKHTLKGSRNTRIDNILSKFDLSDRIYKGDIGVMLNDIDYCKVQGELDLFRNMSIDFLKEELSLAL